MKTIAMKTSERKKINTKLQLSKYIELVCRNNDLNHAYLEIRQHVPIKWEQVKRLYKMYNN